MIHKPSALTTYLIEPTAPHARQVWGTVPPPTPILEGGTAGLPLCCVLWGSRPDEMRYGANGQDSPRLGRIEQVTDGIIGSCRPQADRFAPELGIIGPSLVGMRYETLRTYE